MPTMIMTDTATMNAIPQLARIPFASVTIQMRVTTAGVAATTHSIVDTQPSV